MAAAAAFLALHLPDFGHQRARERLVVFELVVDKACQVAYRESPLLQTVGHQCAQAEAAGVVFHPAGLESGLLAVVAEDQQALSLGVVHHVLGEDMDIGHIGGAHGACGFAVGVAHAPSCGAA